MISLFTRNHCACAHDVVDFRVMRRLCRREWNWLWREPTFMGSMTTDTWSRRVTSDFNSVLHLVCLIIRFSPVYTGWPRNNGTVDTVDFSGLCSNQQLFSSPCWIEHLFPIIITPRSSNLVENFLFYETFLMDCHFRDLPDFQSFEARWQINGKSRK